MMEQRRALTIPFTVDKDKLMENPFAIPVPYLSSECGKLERQVSWTAFAGGKFRHRDSQHKNGSMLFNDHAVTMDTSEMTRRKPCLILTDVLKTEPGKAFMDRKKMSHTLGNQGQVPRTLRERVQCREEPPVCRLTRSSQREARNDDKTCVTPKRTQSTTSSHCQRSRLRRRLQNVEDEVDSEDNKDIKEVIIDTDNGGDYKFSDVVDCGLSVSWEPAKDADGREEFSPACIKDRWTDAENEVQHSLVIHSVLSQQKRKRKDAESQCNGTESPKRHRESVLRLTGEDGGDGGLALPGICLEEVGEDEDLESLDRTIVKFRVGADDPDEVVVPFTSADLEAEDSVCAPRQSPTPIQDNTTNSAPSEPIVLSSDEESGEVPLHCSPAASSHDAVAEQQEASDIEDMQVLRVVVDLPSSISVIPSVDYSCMGVAFSTLRCGGYQGKANGDMMIADQQIIIPLKDTSERRDVMLTFERKDLRRYSVWEQQELEAKELLFKDDEGEPLPAAVLLFCVSEAAAAAVHRDLLRLCAKQDGNTNTVGKASPFILLTLRDPLEGMEGALLRSLLDIDCLNSLADKKSIAPQGLDIVCGLEDIHSPVLSLDDCIAVIRRTGLDSHLLSLLGVESADPTPNADQDGPHSDTDKDTAPHTRLEASSQKETLLELETATERDTAVQVQPEEDQKTQKELEHPSERRKEEPTPAYTLCHRRSKGCYSVSLCKLDSNWTKYKHRGLAHRLIQFPPPPLKGGITVTMEDLQCLDSGLFLNDVIIDFYLKYLLQNASVAVAERCHIFSSFFYKQLTRRDNASEGGTSDSCQRQRRHQRVKTWTRHVDIFKKDFLFVPVNQEAHWYLVVICFPGLDEPKFEAWNAPDSKTEKRHNGTAELQDQESKSPNDNKETPPALNHSDSVDTETENAPEESTKDPPPGPVNCTERTFANKSVCKRPCILIMDSLKLSLHERVFKLLRDYLQSEWEVRRGSSRTFSPDQMQSSHCQVPLQDNSSDCGLYLLQYVESFLKDPVVHFDLPLRLARWFPRQQVRRKRDEIRDLVLNLYRHQNLDSTR